MKLTYDGPHERVFVADSDLVAERGKPVEVPNEIAGREPKGEPDAEGYDPGEGLLAQSVWHKAGNTRKEDS